MNHVLVGRGMLLETNHIRVYTNTYFLLVYITFIMGICKKQVNKSQNEKNTYIIETEREI
ncbi:hypothetical protein BK730_22190 [Bacillus wiedmannii]|uniref:Uncharacterized protein n=1 Tax=Bacillus wiedmannii TaxID=1890302 RepID=A0A242Z0W3_9BACI|nr:hypothetical protein BK730_22190 [Bacillus wiedmannii]